MNKKELYNKIMLLVAKEVKKAINENFYWDAPFDDELDKSVKYPNIGDTIKIIHIDADDNNKHLSDLNGVIGIVKDIDKNGHLVGTWGNIKIIPELDTIEIINDHMNEGECYTGDCQGGVSAPYSTLNNTIGIGDVVPAGIDSIGSGDRFDLGSKKDSVKNKKKSLENMFSKPALKK